MNEELFNKHARSIVPSLTDGQLAQLLEYERLILRYNARINLVSPHSARQFRIRHLLHSLFVARQGVPDGSRVVDWGTGGGLPGVPLAICFPDATFHLVDSSRKKQVLLQAVCNELGLENVYLHWTRAEAFALPVDLAVSRATAPLQTLWAWTTRSAVSASDLICLKGGDLRSEIEELKEAFPGVEVEEHTLSVLTDLDYFNEKNLLRCKPC